MNAQQIELLSLMTEASELPNKPTLTEQEKRRNTYVLAAISVIKGGVSLRDFDAHHTNHEAIRQNGNSLPEFKRDFSTAEQRAHATAWLQFAKEGRVDLRNQGIGTVAGSYLNGVNGGSFVPFDFFANVKAAMAQADPLVDPNVVTYVETKTGHPIQYPIYSDVDNVATVEGEGSTPGSESDLGNPGAVLPPVFTYRNSKLWKISIEAMQDLGFSAVELFTKFAADRIARGVGIDLVSGNGISKPAGLVPSLVNLGATVSAAGSAANSGGTETATNSIGSADLSNLFFSVNAAYRAQPKAGWLMNDTTLQYLVGLLDKVGQPVVKVAEGLPTILGKPVHVSPSMDNIGTSQHPIAFGDLSFWVTRCVNDSLNRVQRYTNTPGTMDSGAVGFRIFARYGGALLYTASGDKSPIKLLQNAS